MSGLLTIQRAITTATVIGASSIAIAQAPPGYAVKELATCQANSNPSRTPDSATASRTKASVIVVVQAYAHCASEMRPVIVRSSGRMSIQLDERFTPSVAVAGCNCLRSFKITFSQPVARGTQVYLVRNGQAQRLARVP